MPGRVSALRIERMTRMNRRRLQGAPVGRQRRAGGMQG